MNLNYNSLRCSFSTLISCPSRERPIVEFWLSADTDTIGQKPILSADCIGRLFTNKKHRILSTFYFEAVLTCTENWHAWNFLCILGFFNVFPFEKKTLFNFFFLIFSLFLQIFFWKSMFLSESIGRYFWKNRLSVSADTIGRLSAD